MKRLLLLISVLGILVFMTACTKDVEDMDYSLKYNDKTYSGSYTGTIEDDKPTEKGKFQYGDEGDKKYLIYDGKWKKGKMKGKGYLSTNNYVVHFLKTDDKKAFDIVGTYDGDVKDGLANGNGFFTAVNDENVQYTYTGEWKDGLFDGQGEQRYKSKEHPIKKGNFEKGDFKPDIVDAIRAHGTIEAMCPYYISEEDARFIKKNEKAFLNHNKKMIKENLKKKFSLKKFRKNSSALKPCFVKFNSLTVQQVFEKDNAWGYSRTVVLLYDDNDNKYVVYYFGKSKRLKENNVLDITIMPHDYSTFESTDKVEVWAVVGTMVDF